MNKLAALLLLCLAQQACAGALPTPAEVKAAWRDSDAQLLDRHGEPLQELRVDFAVRRRAWTALSDIAPAMQEAIVRAEDRRFWEHGGVDQTAGAKAAWENLFRSRARGASTITMQLAGLLDKNLNGGSGGRSIGQKWDQLQAARELEAGWSKKEILEAYLNLVSFRGELQGIAAASASLFGKAPAGLAPNESAILAALVRAPNAADKLVVQRACQLAPASACPDIGELARSAFRRRAQEAGELAGPVARQLLKTPGQRVVSTLDAGLQRFALDSLHQQMALLRERNVTEGAILVLDNASGAVLAWVANSGSSSVDGVTALRQAGSTLKPFLYGLALEKRLLTAASILDDSAIDIATPVGIYAPQNYDRDFKGHASVRTSLAGSLNVPAVRTLMLTGLHPFHERLRALGFDNLKQAPEYYGFALALGSAEVSLLELTNAYRSLANGGRNSGISLTLHGAKPQRALLDPRAVFIIGDILADRGARSITFGLQNELATPYWSAAKTGTSKDMRDNWCVGYSTRFTVGVWVGNFNGEPMWDVSGVTGAAPIWRDLMDYLARDGVPAAPKPPAGLVSNAIRYAPELEPARSEWFIAGTESKLVELLPPLQQTARIRYPAAGTIMALDPDIPPNAQRVFFRAQGSGNLSWQLDDDAPQTLHEMAGWQPVAGKHRLRLLGQNGSVVDEVVFEVRL